MSFTDAQNKALAAPLDPKHIKAPPKGKFGSYVDGFHIVTEANRIFGFDGWSYEITMLEQCARVETTDSKGAPQVRIGYRCTVRTDVGGVCREGAAVGTGMAKPENEADAHESAVKEAETDALKRALRSFGYTFGLALYDKSGDNANIGSAPVEQITDQQRTELELHFEAKGVPIGRFLDIAGLKNLRELAAADFRECLAWIDREAKAMA